MAKAAETISTPGPDRDDADPGLTLDDLIAFGRDYLEALEAGAGIELSKGVLKQYLARTLVLLQAEQAHKKPKKPRSTGGRPPGTSMGEDVLRLMANGMGEQQALGFVPVRKPQRQEFVRVHRTIRGTVALVEDKTDNEEYIVSDPDRKGFVKALSEALPGEVVLKVLYLTVTRQGTWFLWPIKLPGSDGKELDWTRSSREAAQMAMSTWLRVASNRSLGAYDIFTAEKITTEPVWPDISGWAELLRIAFRSRLITSFDHPLIRNLTGE